jgi:hypothetical protein
VSVHVITRNCFDSGGSGSDTEDQSFVLEQVRSERSSKQVIGVRIDVLFRREGLERTRVSVDDRQAGQMSASSDRFKLASLK